MSYHLIPTSEYGLTVSHCNITWNCKQGSRGPQHAYAITSRNFITATIRTTSWGQRSIIESPRDLCIYFCCVKHKTVGVEVVHVPASLCTAAALARFQACPPPLDYVQRSVPYQTELHYFIGWLDQGTCSAFNHWMCSVFHSIDLILLVFKHNMRLWNKFMDWNISIDIPEKMLRQKKGIINILQTLHTLNLVQNVTQY